MIRIPRPGDTSIHIVYGQRERAVETQNLPSATHESQGPFNTPFEKPGLGKFYYVSPLGETRA